MQIRLFGLRHIQRQDTVLKLGGHLFGLHIAHVEAAAHGTGVTLPADVAALLVLLILIKTLCGLNSQVAIAQVNADLVFLEAGQIDRQLIAVFLLPDIGLHQILGVLAIQGAAALRDVHHAKGIVKEIIKQIFSKNAGQHKSFLHSNLLCSLRRGFLFFAPLFGTPTLYHDF